MRFETTPRWDADWKILKTEHRRQFRDAIPDFNAACDAYARTPEPTTSKGRRPVYPWPAALRVSPMKSAPGVWEMTWSFASPDGRATFEFIHDEEGLVVRWRRIGDHSIYRSRRPQSHDPSYLILLTRADRSGSPWTWRPQPSRQAALPHWPVILRLG